MNVIEASAYLNLVILSAAALADANSPVLVHCLVGIAFVTMLGIVAFHVYISFIAKSKMWLRMEEKLLKIVGKLKTGKKDDITPTLEDPNAKTSHDPHKIVSKTEIKLREPLLGDSIQQ